jgi:hypothetical protein
MGTSQMSDRGLLVMGDPSTYRPPALAQTESGWECWLQDLRTRLVYFGFIRMGQWSSAFIPN